MNKNIKNNDPFDAYIQTLTESCQIFYRYRVHIFFFFGNLPTSEKYSGAHNFTVPTDRSLLAEEDIRYGTGTVLTCKVRFVLCYFD